MTKTTLMPSVGKQEWSQAADDAREAASSVGEMASHAALAVSAMAVQAVGDVGRKADDLTSQAGYGIQALSDSFSRSTPQSGILGNASQAVAKAVNTGGEYLRDTKLSGLSKDVARVIRRNPIPAVLIALGLGWFAARKLGR